MNSCSMKSVLIFNLFISAQRDASQVQSVRNTQETNKRRRLRHEGQSSSVPACCSWTDLEIRIFLQEWEVVEQEIHHPGKKMKKKNSAICQRLYQMGLKKCWESCLDLMWTLKDLHTTLCNERPGIVPLFSPYAEALYRILGPRWQDGHVQGAWYGRSGNTLPSMCPQPPMVMPPPVYQPWDYDMSASSGQLHGNPSMMVSSQYSLDPGSEAWNATYPRTVPHILPAFVPGDTNLQVPWSTYE
ncbi:uncharacterized protein MSANTD5-like [Arvicanthis niloticus]|uniref:uncharacterized protein MSANTD5-like n=1 Tax=Arvicanthis niloticus TaxID=61156 RepID=UPI001485EF8A|nr:uncharacterized protein LOC117705598 [Arvicanthis niloticus]